jgi:hypothetical protein
VLAQRIAGLPKFVFMNFSLRCARLLLPALMLASAVRAQDATTPLAGIKLEVAEKNTLAALTGAAHDAGAEIGEATDAVPEDAEVLILSSRHLRHLHRDDAAQLEGRLEAFLKKGGSIIFTLPDNGDTFKSVENLLPVNVWPV